MARTLLDILGEFCQRHGLAGQPGIIAISGGPDSVALAHLCATLCQQQRLSRIALAHLNHQLRGEASDADEAFVQHLPAAWGFPALSCHTHRLDVTRLAQETRDNLENAARQTRYQWLIDAAQREGAAWVATGHSADDQAETVLHHFLRGSGLQGLAGMAERRRLAPGVDLMRPLLTSRRADVLEYLHEQGLAYRHDASNEDPRFLRNRLRHELLPLLQRDYKPGLVEVLGRTAQQLRDIQDDLTQRANKLLARVELPRAGSMIVLQRPALEGASVVELRELLRLTWQREGWPQGGMGFADWDRAAALLRGNAGSNDFPDGVKIHMVGKVVQLERML
jgi:tRNA(Ile)-lysidine synthase